MSDPQGSASITVQDILKQQKISEEFCMRTTWKPLSNKTKQDDLVGLSRFFVSGEGNEKRKQKMRSGLFLFMVLGLVGLMCGCELETTALSESDISDDYNEEVKKSLRKLILTGNCKECPFVGVDISGKDLSHKDLSGADLSEADLTEANLKGANMKNIRNLDSAIKCKTIMPWGEDNSGCK